MVTVLSYLNIIVCLLGLFTHIAYSTWIKYSLYNILVYDVNRMFFYYYVIIVEMVQICVQLSS